jgi:hypothetical protein
MPNNGIPSIPATVRQTTILDDGRAPSVYRFWDRYYTPEVLAQVLERTGFRVVDVFAALTGTRYTPARSSLAIVAWSRA